MGGVLPVLLCMGNGLLEIQRAPPKSRGCESQVQCNRKETGLAAAAAFPVSSCVNVRGAGMDRSLLFGRQP